MTTTEFFVGIDPGVSGGIAVVNRTGEVILAEKMPATDRDVLDILLSITNKLIMRAVLERVASSPQMGVVSAFKFGVGYGALRMALTAAKIPFDEATPMKWQGVMMCLPPRPRVRPGMPPPKPAAFGTKNKNITKRRAQQLFPQAKITHAIADALLLADYCRRGYLTGTFGRATPVLLHGVERVVERDGLGFELGRRKR